MVKVHQLVAYFVHSGCMLGLLLPAAKSGHMHSVYIQEVKCEPHISSGAHVYPHRRPERSSAELNTQSPYSKNRKIDVQLKNTLQVVFTGK